MQEIKQVALLEHEAIAFRTVADVMERLEVERPNDVMFDSCDMYYVSCKDVAERLREMAPLL